MIPLQAQLVIEQGQSLMEQQAAIRSQYQEDIDAHQSRVKTLEDIIAEKDQQLKKLKAQDKAARSKIDSIEENLRTLKETHIRQHSHHQSELADLYEQLETKNQNDEMQQKKIKELERCNKEAEQQLLAQQEEAARECETERFDRQQLLLQHAEEKRIWQESTTENARREKATFERKTSEFDVINAGFNKEMLHLSCRIAELEDKLEEKETMLSTLKDTIQSLAEDENKYTSNYNELFAEFQENKDLNQKLLEEKESEIIALRESKVNSEKESQKHSQQTIKTIEGLKAKLSKLTNENFELSQKLTNQKDDTSSVQSAFDEAKYSAGQFSSMRALLSRKESSKAILVAEQQRLEQEYSTAMSVQVSALNNLEQEMKSLQNENATLKARTEVACTEVLTGNSYGSLQQSLRHEPESLAKILIARRESSNQILAAENTKMKTELKNAKAWWAKDINELQKRNTSQLTAMSHMERKLTMLETENNHLKTSNINLSAYPSCAASHMSTHVPRETQAAGHEHLTDYHKWQPIIKEYERESAGVNSIDKESNADTHDQGAVPKIDLKQKLSQNEIDAGRIQSHLQEAEISLDKQDHIAAQNLLRQSNVELQVLLENIKHASQSASDTVKILAEKQNSLINLHKQFSKTLGQIQEDSESTHANQRIEMETLHKHYENQIIKLQESLRRVQSEVSSKSENIVTLTTEKTQVEAALHQVTEDLRNMKLEASNSNENAQVFKTAKLALENRATHLEKTVKQLELDNSNLEAKCRLAKTDNCITMERELTQLRSQHEAHIVKQQEVHRKEIDELAMRLRNSEKEQNTLNSEINRLQEKLFAGPKQLQEEVQTLHGQVQKLTIEKTELQERFRDGLATLKVDYELIIKERTNQIQRLYCQIAEQEAKNQTINDEYTYCKDALSDQNEEIKHQKVQSIERIDRLASQLEISERKSVELNETVDLKRKELAKALDSLTQMEIDCVRLRRQSKQDEQQQHDLTAKYEAKTKEIKLALNDSMARNKQLEADNQLLKKTFNKLQSDYNIEEEKFAVLKQDLQHVESLSKLYKSELETVKQESESRHEFAKQHALSQSSILPTDKSSSQFVTAVQSIETTDGLGSRTAELCNKVAQLQINNSMLKSQLELTDMKIKDLLKTNRELRYAIDNNRDTNDYQAELEKRTAQLKKTQTELQQTRSSYEYFKSSYDQDLQYARSQLLVTENDYQALQEKLSEITAQKETAVMAAESEAALTKHNDNLKKTLTRERENSFQIEQQLRNQARTMQKESVTMKKLLEDAFQANQSLEKYIRHLQQSFTEVFKESKKF